MQTSSSDDASVGLRGREEDDKVQGVAEISVVWSSTSIAS
jgi:hypothetical protein